MAIVNVRATTRVSSEEQKLHGYSLEAQRERLERLVSANPDWRIVEWYVDDGYSAKSLNRPGMQRLLNDVQSGDVVLVYKLDRLTRRVADLEYLVSFFEKKGVVLRSANENIDTSTASGRFFLRQIIEIAQWERETISERSSMGLRQKIKSGGYKGGPPPFGYTTAPSGKIGRNGKQSLRLVPDPQTAHIVEAMFRRYISGQGARALALWLNNEVCVNTTRGRRWTAISVARVLRNPTYLGYSVSRTKNGVLELHDGDHDAIIDKATFETAQQTLDARKVMAPRQATGKYVLSGIARCGQCGGSITSSVSRSNPVYIYRCYNHAIGRGCGDTPLQCFVGHAAEAKVIDEIRLLLEGQNIEAMMHEFRAEAQQRSGASTAELERVKSELADVNQRIARWESAYETGELPLDRYLARIKPLEERRETLASRHNEIGSAVADIPDKDDLRGAAAVLVEAWTGATQPERKAILLDFTRRFRVQIRLYPSQGVSLVPLPRE